VFSVIEIVLSCTLAIFLFKTTERTRQRPRGYSNKNYKGGIELDKGVEFNSNLEKNEPSIKVTIKPRAKDRPTENFKLNVLYEIEMTEEQKRKLDSEIPSTPNNNKVNNIFQDER
jgi:hypothetical protein